MNNTPNTSPEWHMKDGLLTWVDTAEQWEVSDWTQEQFEDFIVLPDYDQLEILAGLEEYEQEDN